MTSDEYYTEPSIDSEGGHKYVLASPEQAKACNKRFEHSGPTVIDPKDPGYLLSNINNWWDGPVRVKVLDNGDLEYTSPYSGETDRFNANGSYYRDGSFHAWSNY